jgi:DNA-binding response OmpR family regulator
VGNKAKEYLTDHHISPVIAAPEMDYEQSINNYVYLAVILNFNKYEHESFEILRMLKSNSPSTKVILSLSSENDIINDTELKSELDKIGINNYLIKPYSMDTLGKQLELLTHYEDWSSIQRAITTGDHNLAVTESDTVFNTIPIEIF